MAVALPPGTAYWVTAESSAPGAATTTTTFDPDVLRVSIRAHRHRGVEGVHTSTRCSNIKIIWGYPPPPPDDTVLLHFVSCLPCRPTCADHHGDGGLLAILARARADPPSCPHACVSFCCCVVWEPPTANRMACARVECANRVQSELQLELHWTPVSSADRARAFGAPRQRKAGPFEWSPAMKKVDRRASACSGTR